VLRVVVQPLVKFRQFADVKDAAVQGKGKGQEFHWNVYSDVPTHGTTLLETTTMPETNYTITQGTMTITEYGNSVPYTEKLDDLSLHPVKEVIAKVRGERRQEGLRYRRLQPVQRHAAHGGADRWHRDRCRYPHQQRHGHHHQQRGAWQRACEGDCRPDEGAQHSALHGARLCFHRPDDPTPRQSLAASDASARSPETQAVWL